MTSADIRAKFLRFFEQRGHTVVPSSSLVPANDPTLLFTNAGMVQFKDVFTGLEARPYSRATSAQKCLRVSGKHNDLDSVGPSPRHHTFFEMLGNFSFGDYFKAEAIRFAWEFLIDELGLDRERLYATIYQDDDEAFELWQKVAGLSAERITRLGKKDNFWQMGDTGPCGPCSEIIYDRGPEACTCHRPDCNLAGECDRWLELWNLVFMQYEQHADGTLTPLPRPSIDTGMGLERVTSVLQGANNNYDTDLFLPIMHRARELLGQDEAAMRENLVAYRVIADHSRAITFLIADGVIPGNEGRSYVARMVLRRAARFGRRLGFEEPFLAETARVVIEIMGPHYTELQERADFICEAITQEEQRFLATLSTGLARLDELASRLEREGRTEIPGEEAFRLYDTYGFPLELTRDAAAEMGLTVDEAGFQRAMAQQRERARSAQQFAIDERERLYRSLDLLPTQFVGYETCVADGRVLTLVKEGQPVKRVIAEEWVEVVLDRTPFYGEAGGQVGDQGELRGDGVRLLVHDAVRPLPDLIVHRAQVIEGSLQVGDVVIAQVDRERRLDIARNHTATHLLHSALRQVLGEHATQAGSLVAPDRLRFDFAHLSPLSAEQRRRVEAIVNAKIRENLPVTVEVTSYEQARREGAMALFGEKYGDQVRMVRTGDFALELCGGTHLQSTGQIGFFLIVGESSIGSGLRRIEALTGRGAEEYVRRRLDDLARVAEMVSARPGEEAEKVQALLDTLREQRRTLAELQRQLAARSVGSLLDEVQEVAGVRVLAAQVQADDVDTLRQMGDRFRDKLGSAVVALGTVVDGRPLLIVALTKDLVERGLHAGKIAGEAARRMGGGGGGRPDMAQAGGKNPAGLAEALRAIPDLVVAALG
ncbi:MAG: alanine--tRNA ligase [Chloroflexi bacterium]|nr:alanine--tRNA ligase [Chloroflexota bacterium]